jgi:hypothetical protein
MPTITRKDQNTQATGGRSSLGQSLSPFTSPSMIVGQDEACQLGDLYRPVIFISASWSGQPKSVSGRAALGFPQPFHGRHL